MLYRSTSITEIREIMNNTSSHIQTSFSKSENVDFGSCMIVLNENNNETVEIEYNVEFMFNNPSLVEYIGMSTLEEYLEEIEEEVLEELEIEKMRELTLEELVQLEEAGLMSEWSESFEQEEEVIVYGKIELSSIDCLIVTDLDEVLKAKLEELEIPYSTSFHAYLYGE